MSGLPKAAQTYLDEFQHILSVATNALAIAKRQQRMFMFGKAINTLNSKHVIKTQEISIEEVSIFDGFEKQVLLNGDDLLGKLDECVKKTTSTWSTIKSTS
jgi:hypothetical protein